MLMKLKRFKAAEDGAVTVDWVVLTGAIVGLGLAVISIVSDGATSKANGLGSFVGEKEPGVL